MQPEAIFLVGLGIASLIVSIVAGYVGGRRADQNAHDNLRKEMEEKIDKVREAFKADLDTLQERVHIRIERLHERISDQREVLRKDLHEKMGKVDTGFKAFDQALRSFELEMRALATEIAGFKSRHGGK